MLKTLFKEQYLRARLLYGCRIFTKNKKWYPLWLTVHWLLKILSFGKLNRFMDDYTITVGPYIFVPTDWDENNVTKANYVTLCHELDHIRLYREIGGIPWFGAFLVSLFYLFLPLPIGLAWFRYATERRAYLVTHQTLKQLGEESNIDTYVKILTGSSYLWAWPFKKQVRNWFEKNA